MNTLSMLEETKPESISLEKKYELIREQIRHEDGLINQRLNWLLLSQGFLFAAFTSIIANSENTASGMTTVPNGQMASGFNVLWPLMVIAITGLLLNTFSFVGLSNAYQSLKYLRENWRLARPADSEGRRLYESFPNITWEGSAITTASSSPIVITLAWMSMTIWMLLSIPNQTIWAFVVMGIVTVICLWIIIWMIVQTQKGLNKKEK